MSKKNDHVEKMLSAKKKREATKKKSSLRTIYEGSEEDLPSEAGDVDASEEVEKTAEVEETDETEEDLEVDDESNAETADEDNVEQLDNIDEDLVVSNRTQNLDLTTSRTRTRKQENKYDEHENEDEEDQSLSGDDATLAQFFDQPDLEEDENEEYDSYKLPESKGRDEEEALDEELTQEFDEEEAQEFDEDIDHEFQPNQIHHHTHEQPGMEALTVLQRKKIYETVKSLAELAEKPIEIRSKPLDKITYKKIADESKELLDTNLKKAKKNTPGFMRYKDITTEGNAENLSVSIPNDEGSVDTVTKTFDEKEKIANITVTNPPSDKTIGLTLELNRKLSPLEMKTCHNIEIIIRFYEASLLARMEIRFSKKDQELLKTDERYLLIQEEIKKRGQNGFRKYLHELNTEDNPRPLGSPLPKGPSEDDDHPDSDGPIRFTG